MRKATDTTLRSIAVLSAIPAHPRSKSTRQIREQLAAMNPDFEVDVRSVQRDLEKLSALFPITSDVRGRANYWYWIDQHALTQIPSMTGPTAFVLRLAAEYLKPIVPPSTLRQLDAYFKHADRVLEGTALGRWTDKAAIIRQGPLLKPPPIRDDVQEAVYTALLENRRIEVGYGSKNRARPSAAKRLASSASGPSPHRPRTLSDLPLPWQIRQPPRRFVLNPLGVVVRAGVVYLVATTWEYDDIRHYVLHRMSAPELLDEPVKVPRGFRLAAHIREDRRFSYPLSAGKLELKALFDADAAVHLTESRLATDHRTTEQEDGRVLVEATVPDTADLRWWLLGFGGAVEVLGPETLRTEFREQVRRMEAIYR